LQKIEELFSKNVLLDLSKKCMEPGDNGGGASGQLNQALSMIKEKQ
jgi:hypothetical protein